MVSLKHSFSFTRGRAGLPEQWQDCLLSLLAIHGALDSPVANREELEKGRVLWLIWSCLSLSPGGSQSWLVPGHQLSPLCSKIPSILGTSGLWNHTFPRVDLKFWLTLAIILPSPKPSPLSRIPLRFLPLCHPCFPSVFSRELARCLELPTSCPPGASCPGGTRVHWSRHCECAGSVQHCPPHLPAQAFYPWSLHTSSCWDHRRAAVLRLLGVTWRDSDVSYYVR